METALQGRDIWIKRTSKEGQSWTSFHRVYDIGLFMSTRQAEAVKEGGKAKVEQVLKPAR